METTKTEFRAIEKATNERAKAQLNELTDLELALIGGGTGDVLLG